MSFDFLLPDLGEGMAEGEVRKWLVREGDSVEEHQAVVEIETDKAVVEVPSPKAGRVSKIIRREGDVVKVGEPLMSISTAEEIPEKKSVSVVGVLPEEEEVLAPPAVRAYAKERGVSLEGLKGSGPSGSITVEDVMMAAAEKSEKGPEEETEEAARVEEPFDKYGAVERLPIRGIRRTIAKNLLTTLRTYASVTGMDEADVTELWELREKEKGALRKKGVHLTFVPFFIKAVQHALPSHPLLNSSVDEAKEEIVMKRYINIGIATDTPDGLMVPVIKDVDKKTIVELAGILQGLTARARERKITLEELKGGTFTVTNFGSFGGAFATPIINYPETAILGTGRITEKPWVRNGKIEIRKILPLSLSFDHRVTDGADASRFLARVISYLEDPASVFIESH